MKLKIWFSAFALVAVMGASGYFWSNQKSFRMTVHEIAADAELHVLFDEPWELNAGNAAELNFINIDSPKDSFERRVAKSEFREGKYLPLKGLVPNHTYRLAAIVYLCKHTDRGLCTRNPKEAMLRVIESGSKTLELKIQPKT